MLLNDNELRNFQLEVFNGELTTKDIKGIKDVIREEVCINEETFIKRK